MSRSRPIKDHKPLTKTCVILQLQTTPLLIGNRESRQSSVIGKINIIQTVITFMLSKLICIFEFFTILHLALMAHSQTFSDQLYSQVEVCHFHYRGEGKN